MIVTVNLTEKQVVAISIFFNESYIEEPTEDDIQEIVQQTVDDEFDARVKELK